MSDTVEIVCCDQNRVALRSSDALRSGFLGQLLDGCNEIDDEGLHLVNSSTIVMVYIHSIKGLSYYIFG